ncbi:3-isopropylmalate/(R)-2-methylmalate dehydratase small subunit [Desulfonatronum thiosulfatophilum]|uniref:3-isopropylmalate dehydratase small subunit n=1 Tax=Desulfonatronum thiosulfatophilum TaxID=617002 RepID=A0A1G6AAQ5_9BACT|nr:3-isopropylmalate dehydratase small subunit [Desulfonatronum thiosulfatophilum]SDB05507.1 3-isopropylmalate/(R)-2-methylmalate dehydratase small subunit [Desulfonatronum thiosulfatophilum]
MIYTGAARKVGANIDTDAIIPARFLVTTDPLELGKNCFEGLESGWINRVTQGDILVAGPNFGCGSSREHAPIAILGAGMPVVLAHSFARIFYRNGFNMGLTLLEIGDAVNDIREGDRLEVDAEKGLIRNLDQDRDIPCTPVPRFMQDILAQGGLVGYVRRKMAV